MFIFKTVYNTFQATFLKSGTHGHHQMLGILLCDALPGLYCSRLQVVCGSFGLLLSLQQVKSILDQVKIRRLTTIEEYSTTLP